MLVNKKDSLLSSKFVRLSVLKIPLVKYLTLTPFKADKDLSSSIQLRRDL